MDGQDRQWKYAFVPAAGRRTLRAYYRGAQVWKPDNMPTTGYGESILDRADIQDLPYVAFSIETIPNISHDLASSLQQVFDLIQALLRSHNGRDAKEVLDGSHGLFKKFASVADVKKREQFLNNLVLSIAFLPARPEDREYSECVETLREIATIIDPQNRSEFPVVLNAQAWQMSVSTLESKRDGHRAVELASRACELTDFKDANYLDTLAAAYAQAGNFQSAIAWAEKALALKTGDEAIEEHLETFRQGKPWREP
jgi:hypothetical protein